MLAIFLKTVPFFALIGVGYLAGRTRFFSEEATAYLTRFVFYFALSAMLFGFAANLDVAAIFSWPFVLAYLLGTTAVWLVVTAVAVARGTSREEAVFEAHTGVIGNVGYGGIDADLMDTLKGPDRVNGVIGLQNSQLTLQHSTLDHTDRRRIRSIDSSLVVRKIADLDRVLCASPVYLGRKGAPRNKRRCCWRARRTRRICLSSGWCVWRRRATLCASRRTR